MPEACAGTWVTDEHLVDRARQGDRSGLEDLFRRHALMAQRVAYRLLGNEQDAQDAVQEAFIKAVVHLNAFDGRSGFRTWLIRIVTNSARDAGRKRRRRPAPAVGGGGAVEEGGYPSVEPTIEHDPALGLRQQDLRRALDSGLDRLKPTIRETFVLFAEAGLSYQEIAQAQKVPIGTVMSRIHYARQKLQSSLKGIDGL